jgi:hypothetical protein
MRRSILGLCALALPLAALGACNIPDPRPAQQAECDNLGGTYRADPEGAREDECTVTARNGVPFTIEYDDVHTASGAPATGGDD